MNFSSQNILYVHVIKCNGCGEDYIGQTINELRKRMPVYKQPIKNPHLRMIPLSNHLHNCPKNKTEPFLVFPCINSKKMQMKSKELEKKLILLKSANKN